MPALELPASISDVDSAFILRNIDKFMVVARGAVLGLVFGAALPHQPLRRCMMGAPTDEDQASLKRLGSQFFSCLNYSDLPEHCLPRLPVRVARFEGKTFHAACGPYPFGRCS